MKSSTSIFDILNSKKYQHLQHFAQQAIQDNPAILKVNTDTAIKFVETMHQNCKDFILARKKKNTPHLIKTIDPILDAQSLSPSAAFIAITTNKSFVTDSILNLINQDERQIIDFLNQIATVDSQDYSITYCEMQHDFKSGFISRLSELLSQVCDINDDYHNMLEEIRAFSKTVSDDEIQKFLDWMCDSNFLFLGCESQHGSESTKLGLAKTTRTLSRESNDNKKTPYITAFKDPELSLIHRYEYCDIVRIQDKESSLSLSGMFSSNAYRAKITEIPMLKTKANNIIDKCKINQIGYNLKNIHLFLNNLFRGEFIKLSESDLLKISKNFLIKTKLNKPSLYHYFDQDRQCVVISVFMARKRISNDDVEKIYNTIDSQLPHNGIRVVHNSGGAVDIMSVRFIIKVNKNSPIETKTIDKTIQHIEESITTLHEQTLNLLKKDSGIKSPELTAEKYKHSFSKEYLLRNSTQSLIQDILTIESRLPSGQNHPLVATLSRDKDKQVLLKLYYTSEFSDQIPFHALSSALDQFDIKIISAQKYTITLQPKIFLHHFTATFPGNSCNKAIENFINCNESQQNFANVLSSVLKQEIENTHINKLAIYAKFDQYDIRLAKTLAHYLKQVKFPLPVSTIESTICINHEITGTIIRYFRTKFNPSTNEEDRKKTLIKLENSINSTISSFTNSADEKIFNHLFLLVKSTVRTNFFLKKNYISIKTHPKNIPGIPQPVPFKEIFIYSSSFHGVHLRSSKVARGGIRWSDRRDDFRTEILGLVKAQNTKNALIIPSGAKGGFCIMESTANLSKDELFKLGKKHYTSFISACLEITDNIQPNGKVQTSPNTLIYDDNDPYFVVAADKGTATFSDLANSISADSNFWLKDAFASGGSCGYDHKKMGITAKGAWICAQQHFREINIDIQSQDFTCVGIGDMSGDVFGNGMLLSQKTKLIGAFNHMHIFIDPNPDTQSSYKERKRLFDKPSSSWADYKAEKLSKGGKIYQRSDKSCQLTPEIKSLLKITQDTLTPDELIATLLKSQFDLLWNGGIGTYIKASSESNQDVRDRANDNIRINGSELQCRVVGEGGNLGLTQLGRIEYAINGGRINTDSLDNCAGVNCSDHEVNIKILLNGLTTENKFTTEKKNTLLESMTENVEKLVLDHSTMQSKIITTCESLARTKLTQHEQLINLLEKIKLLNRENEFLPSSQEMRNRKASNQGLTRPELSVLFAYSKIHLRNQIVISNLPKLQFFDKYLASYFPDKMQSNFSKYVKSHALRKEIITTVISNIIVNTSGIATIHNIQQDTEREIEDVVLTYFLVYEVFEIKDIQTQIHSLPTDCGPKKEIELLQHLHLLQENLVYRILPLVPSFENIENLISQIKPKAQSLKKAIISELESDKTTKSESFKSKIFQKNSTPHKGESEVCFNDISALLEMSKMPETLFDHKQINNMQQVSRVYRLINNTISISNIEEIISRHNQHQSYWNFFALRSITQSIYASYASIICTITKESKSNTDTAFEAWKSKYHHRIQGLNNFLEEIKLLDTTDFSVLTILAEKIHALFNK